MTKTKKIHTFILYIIALVWLINGLFFKILDFMPRHQTIVGRILGDDYAFWFTKLIGFLEILMVIWVLSGIKARFCAVFQIVIILTMNLIEFFKVSDILMFGKINLIVAISFCALIYYNEFFLRENKG